MNKRKKQGLLNFVRLILNQDCVLELQPYQRELIKRMDSGSTMMVIPRCGGRRIGYDRGKKIKK
jgi:hypothetical protein